MNSKAERRGKFGILYMITAGKIEDILRKSFHIIRITVEDDSRRHAGHTEAEKSGGGHFIVTVISRDFEGKSLIERHRMVQNALKAQMPQNIHALNIKALAPTEVNS